MRKFVINCFKFLLFISYIYWCRSEGVTIKINDKKFLGIVSKTQYKNNTYHAFISIKYGEAQRFEPPKPAKFRSGVYNATFERPFCIQLVKTKFPESDDCLFLSVYVPKISKNTLLPVMFWITGGSFLEGGAPYYIYGPDYLLDENVIVVTINFRIGIFGFLSTGDEILPGNLGLKDVILGLKWVQDNIKFFGGDPKNVTIFGESAGAVMASYLTLTPLTQGLFKGAILQSGTALAPWSFQRKPLELFKAVVLSTPCFLTLIGGTKNALNCLKKLSPDELRVASVVVLGVKTIILLGLANSLPFAPVLEKPSKTAVITTTTYTKLLKNNTKMVPMIIGINSEEGLHINDGLLTPIMEVLFNFVQDIIIPENTFISSLENKAKARETIQNYYMDKFFILTATKEEITRFVSDSYFVRQWRQYLTMVETKTPTYCYILSYGGKIGFDGKQSINKDMGQVGHGDDMNYIWRNSYSENTNFKKQDYVVRKRIVRMWTNFAKFGNPTPGKEEILENVTWHTSNYKGANNNCLDIGYNLNVTQNFKEEAYRMWKNIYDTFGNPKDTY